MIKLGRGQLLIFILIISLIVGCIDQKEEKLDTDNDTIIDELDPDADNDCIKDEWEIKYGLDPLNPADKYQDIDGDGVDNKNEFDTSTDPTDPNDFSLQMKENITKYGTPLYLNASFLYGSLNETDFDDDGISDEMERLLLMDPADPSDAWSDFDNDGVVNKVEISDANTDPSSS